MSQAADQHRASAPRSVRCAVITISDSRTLETDTGGQGVVERMERAGHSVVERNLIPDDPQQIRLLLERLAQQNEIEAILITGGTGVASRDQTYETVTRLLTKQLPGYGELFRVLSFEQIGAAAMLSRATAGLINRIVVFTMPGSPAAVELAMDKLILPELGHLVGEARS